jgi:hypothetical protein
MIKFLVAGNADINAAAENFLTPLFITITKVMQQNNGNTNATATLLISHLDGTRDTGKTIELAQDLKVSLVTYIDNHSKKFIQNMYDTHVGNQLRSKRLKIAEYCIGVIDWLEKSGQPQTAVIIELIDNLKKENRRLSEGETNNLGDLENIAECFQAKFAEELTSHANARHGNPQG